MRVDSHASAGYRVPPYYDSMIAKVIAWGRDRAEARARLTADPAFRRRYGRLDPEAETVIINSGDGLKTLDAVSDHVGPTAPVPSTTKAVREALRAAGR